MCVPLAVNGPQWQFPLSASLGHASATFFLISDMQKWQIGHKDQGKGTLLPGGLLNSFPLLPCAHGGPT